MDRYIREREGGRERRREREMDDKSFYNLHYMFTFFGVK